MGFHFIENSDNTNISTSQDIEDGYAESLKNLMRNGIADINQYNRILQERHDNTDPAYAALVPIGDRRTTFSFHNDAEVREVFDNLWEDV
ncbi:hypothetical protein EB837_21920 [Kluyvera ascorbata]|uniref:Uncharacterized protein n=2 Tax=Kluyvera ascorbata TaxID=51288 RepID=A0A3N2RS54_9ENTR|nr:hypothetical protein EB837_21920 [Kluyvera ascorbata]